MGLFDARNITRRADRLMKYHIEMLNQMGNHFELDGEGYLSFEPDSEDYLRVGYNKTKKTLSRTFNLEIKQVIKNIEFDDNFKIKLRFQGLKEITGAKFISEKGKGMASGYEALFNDSVLVEKIWRLAKEVEMAYVKIEYIKRSNQLEIRICPYAGAFLWVVVPPVFYDMKLKKPEMEALIKMIGIMKDYVLAMADEEDGVLDGPAA